MNMLGIHMDCLSYEEMYDLFDQWLTRKDSRSHTLSLVNVNCCVSALLNNNLRGVFNSADIVGIDSMPFLYWARVFYYRKSDRIYAPDLFLDISSRAKEKGYTFYLYGGYPDAPDKLEAYLKHHYEGIRIVGKYSPPFRPLTEEEDQEICMMINRAQPDFFWIGLGSPKQDIWLHEHRDKIKGTIMIPSGATFDFYSGRIKQAPRWIRQSGFEWLYRLFQDFRRLWVRYTIYNIIFIVVFSLQLLGIVNFNSESDQHH